MVRFLLALFFCSMTAVSAQAENPSYAAVAYQFMERYNSGNYNALFDMFNSDMKKALPRERTLEFFTSNVNRPMGSIVEMRFSALKSGAHIYRTRFEKAVADVLISLDQEQMIKGLYISAPKANDKPIIERNKTRMALPFADEWYVFWGGETEEDNYHVAFENQKFAYDLVMVSNGSSFEGDPKQNESYHVFGKEIIAPCDARVVKVIRGVYDNVPGEFNQIDATGNTVVLQTDNNEYILFAHLKEKSIQVEEGQDIRKGELLGLCGNSGNSSEPHLHLSLQNQVDMVGARGGRIYFDQIMVNGEQKTDYLPSKGDFIKNIDNP